MSNKSFKAFLIFSAVFLCLPFAVLAHNPRLVNGVDSVSVQNPEISQAFYGQLKGEAQIFEINSDKDFNLYVGVLVPKMPEVNKGISAEIYRSLESDMELIAALDGSRYAWTEVYEPFGGDYYWRGPEAKQRVPAGKYIIRVFSGFETTCHPELSVKPCLENQGKYSLVIGETEYFPPEEIWNTLVTLPVIKQYFFNKNPLTMFWSYIGLSLLAVIILLAAIIYLSRKLIGKFLNKKNG